MAKITDPSKLLPSTKSTAITKIGKGSFISPIKISKKTTSITKGLIGEGSDKDTVEVNNKLLKVEKFLKSDLITSKKKAETRRKEKEREDFKKEEEKLEAPKEAKKFNLPGLNVPGMSFLDRIKRFLFFTALGWLFTKFQDQLPKLQGIIKVIVGVYGVAEGIFKSLLSGLVNFIDIGYQTYDGLRKKVEDLGGKDAVKTFDEFSGHLNKLINGAIIAATLIASTNPKILKTPKAPTGGAGYQAGFAAGYAAGIASRGRPGAGFRDPSRYRVPGQARSGGFDLEQTRKAATAARSAAPTGPRGPLDRIGRSLKGAGAQLQTGTLFKRGAGLQKGLYNAPGKLKGAIPKGAKFGAGKIPIVGPLITFGIRTLVYGEKPQKAAAAAVGTGVGQAIGTFIGTLGAGALGLGTAGLGAVVAPLIIGAGSVIGGLVGEWIGAKLYDFVAGMGNNKPQLKAAGGSVTRGGKSQGAPKRKIKVSRRRPPKVKPQVSQPGKNVGGKKKIQELYPDPSARVDIEGEQKGGWYDLLPKIPKLKPDATDDEKKEYEKKVDERNAKLKKLPNPYKALTSTAKILKDIPFGIGALMGGAVDIALGQKLPEDAIRGLGNGITYLINSIASRQMSASISNLQKEIVKMQAGGPVPRLRDFTREDSMNTGEGLTKSLNNLIQQKVDQAIKEVQKQMMPGRLSGGGATPPPGQTPPAAPGQTPPAAPATPIPSGQVKQSGKASWYGPGFQGNRTANGEIFDMNKLTAAHVTIPFGTKVTVTNKANGKSVEVRINDRGPYAVSGGKAIRPLRPHPTRIIDLSKAAMVKLDGISAGEIDVELRYGSVSIQPPSPQAPPKNTPSTSPAQPPKPGQTGQPPTQTIMKNYGMKDGDSFTFKTPDGKTYKAVRKSNGFEFYTAGFFGLGGQKIDTTGGKNKQIVDAFIKAKENNQKPTSNVSGKVSIYSGHADMTKDSGGGFGTPGGITKLINPNFLSNEAYINDLVAKRVADKASGLAVYRGPIKTTAARGFNSNWERARRDVSSGVVPFEMHHDEPRGRAGLMMGANANTRLKDPFIKSLNNVYGLHPSTEEKGFFKYGGAILEISNLTPSILKDQKTINDHVERESSKIASALTSAKMQGGGKVANVSSLNSYPSYSTEGGMMIAIQPIIIEKTVPVPMRSSRGISFPVAGVNNSMGNSSSLNQG